jgi:hypothetical protein
MLGADEVTTLKPPVGRPPNPTKNPKTGEPVSPDVVKIITPDEVESRNPLLRYFSPGWYCQTEQCKQNIRYAITGAVLGIFVLVALRSSRNGVQ